MPNDTWSSKSDTDTLSVTSRASNAEAYQEYIRATRKQMRLTIAGSKKVLSITDKNERIKYAEELFEALDIFPDTDTLIRLTEMTNKLS